MTAQAAKGPLAGVRVLDMTGVVLGPLATQILGDFGADVIKIEPLEGDLIRDNGVVRTPGMSSLFLGVNRNKRSLAIDLKAPEGVAAVRKLAEKADLFVHNMRVEAIERLGFGYEAIRAINPRIVYCVATGFGQDGPDRARPAFDDIIQAASGLASLDETPRYVPSLIADKATGIAFVNSILAALFHRERTGEGQYVETPMLETMAAFVLAEHMGGMAFEPRAGAAGYARLLKGGREPARTRDGWIAVLPYTDAHWRAFLGEIGREALAGEIVGNRAAKNARIGELYAALREALETRTTGEWLDICDRLDIPATRIYALDDLPEHPQLAATNFFVEDDHPRVGRVRSTRPPQRFSKTPAEIRSLAPALGEHSADLLREAGLSREEIDALIARGLVRTADGGSSAPRDAGERAVEAVSSQP